MIGSRRSTWSRLSALLGERRGAIASLIGASVLAGVAEAGLLAALAQAAAALVDGSSRVRVEAGPLDTVVTVGFILALAVGFAVARILLQLLIAYLPARLAADVQAQQRSRLFATFSRASWEIQSRDREGHLQELATNQITQATQGALQSAVLIVAASTFFVLFVAALALNIVAAVAVLVVAGGLAALLRPLSSLGRRRSQALSRASIDYAAGINEAVRLAEEAHVFGIAAGQRERIDGLVAAVKRVFFETQLIARLVSGVYQGLVYLLLAGALAVLYASGSGHVASLGAVVLILVRAGAYGQQAQSAYQLALQAAPYLERLEETQERYAESAPGEGLKRLGPIRAIGFEDVGFSYEPGQPVLSGISFEVASGEAIGIVGPSGAGKSTLIQILLGLRSPGSGFYLVNGVPVDRLDRGDWHRRVAYVPQQPRLLHASVAENIRFFRPVDDEAVERAAVLAGIHEDVVGWSDGYDTVVGPRADAVSGGQQQRICIARALACEPDVLVLDEPTSALDPHSEALIQRSLASLKDDLTMFVVAHRLSTIAMCERLMVVVDGRLEAFDRTATVRSTSAYYRSAVTVGQVTET